MIQIGPRSLKNYLPQKLGGLAVKGHSQLNAEAQYIHANVARNCAMGYQEVVPHDEQPTEILLLAGGPSLARMEGDIRSLNAEGMPIVTVNGTYNWCLQRGLRPGAQIILDSRTFNQRFVEPAIPGCKYLLASQCAANVMDAVPRDKLWMWHGEHGQYIVPGGSTVILRAIPLLIMLGFRNIHIYGFDSCLDGDEHHAYEQAENANQMAVKVHYHERIFNCHGWMVTQAQEFCDMQRMLPDNINLAVYGDGLIAHIIRSCAH